MKHKNRFFTCGGLSLLLISALLCLTFSLFAHFYALDGPSIQSGENRAGPILIALEEYHDDTGAYPAGLVELTPAYLSVIPRPAWRRTYLYSYELRNNRQGFVLFFEVGRNMDGDICGYSNQTKEWRCADSMPPY
ncbi:MAG: hypothetical protein HYZ22_09555 [Chloroflexi bacterium]|nr:hypothetical protein [Chloroflexota bacterium]